MLLKTFNIFSVVTLISCDDKLLDPHQMAVIIFQGLTEYYKQTAMKMDHLIRTEALEQIHEEKLTSEISFSEREELCRTIVDYAYFVEDKVDSLAVDFYNYYVCNEDYLFEDNNHDYKYKEIRVDIDDSTIREYAYQCLICKAGTDDVSTKLYVSVPYNELRIRVNSSYYCKFFTPYPRFIFARPEGHSVISPIAIVDEGIQIKYHALTALESEFIGWNIKHRETKQRIAPEYRHLFPSIHKEYNICKIEEFQKTRVCASVISILDADKLKKSHGAYRIHNGQCEKRNIIFMVSVRADVNKIQDRGVHSLQCVLKDTKNNRLKTISQYYISNSGSSQNSVLVYIDAEDDQLQLFKEILIPTFQLLYDE